MPNKDTGIRNAKELFEKIVILEKMLKMTPVISRFTAKSFFRSSSATLPILPIISITPFPNIFRFQILPHLFRIIPISLISFNFASLIFYLP